jgi:prepilin-type N-terminal cleavage/methylation domain-containing protein
MKKGFTLIELLVVISIIGVLSSIVLTSLNAARSKARDARRKSDIHQISNSIEQYFTDKGDLPEPYGWCTTVSNARYGIKSCSLPEGGGKGCFQEQIAPYMPSVPLDPSKLVNDRDNYFYLNNGDSTGNFVLCSQLENPTGKTYNYPATAPYGQCVETVSSYNYCLEVK